MKRVIAIGIGIAIAIAGIVGFNAYMVKQSEKLPGGDNNPPPGPPTPSHGRNLSVNLTESVGVSGH